MCLGSILGKPQPTVVAAAPEPVVAAAPASAAAAAAPAAPAATISTPIGETGKNTAAVAIKRRSLLSRAGAVGDTSTASTSGAGAVGKATLGA